jgi:hypothetical protein
MKPVEFTSDVITITREHGNTVGSIKRNRIHFIVFMNVMRD